MRQASAASPQGRLLPPLLDPATQVKERGMSLHTRRKLSTAAALLIGVGMLPFAGGMSASAAPAAPSVTVRHVQKAGSASYKPSPNGSGDPAALSTEITRAFGPEAQDGADAAAAADARGANAARSNPSMSLTHRAKAANPAPAGAGGSAH